MAAGARRLVHRTGCFVRRIGTCRRGFHTGGNVEVERPRREGEPGQEREADEIQMFGDEFHTLVECWLRKVSGRSLERALIPAGH